MTNYTKKLNAMNKIKLIGDNEIDNKAKQLNKEIESYIDKKHIDLEYFLWLQDIAHSAYKTYVKKLNTRRENHIKVMTFHCA